MHLQIISLRHLFLRGEYPLLDLDPMLPFHVVATLRASYELIKNYL
jgi:hypothetical protein